SKIDVINSGTEELFVSVAEAQAADIDRVVAAARNAFDRGPWPSMSHKERAGYLRAIAAEVDARSEEIARIWTTESGVVHKLARDAMGTLGKAFRFYAGLADTFPFQERHTPSAGTGVGLLVREPVGVVAAIIPWNGPAMLTTFKSAPALLAGCTVIL